MSLPVKISAIILVLLGLVLGAGGGQLVSLGGSWYYLLAGIALVAAGVLLWKGLKSGLWLYGGLIAATLVWSLWEVGLDGWALVPRLVGPIILGLWLLTPWVRNRLA